MCNRGQADGITEYRFRRYIIPMCIRLAEVIFELQWSSRLNPMNHGHLWPTVVTAAVDTFPIEVKTDRKHEYLNNECMNREIRFDMFLLVRYLVLFHHGSSICFLPRNIRLVVTSIRFVSNSNFDQCTCIFNLTLSMIEVVKIQMACTFLMDIVFFSGPQ